MYVLGSKVEFRDNLRFKIGGRDSSGRENSTIRWEKMKDSGVFVIPWIGGGKKSCPRPLQKRNRPGTKSAPHWGGFWGFWKKWAPLSLKRVGISDIFFAVKALFLFYFFLPPPAPQGGIFLQTAFFTLGNILGKYYEHSTCFDCVDLRCKIQKNQGEKPKIGRETGGNSINVSVRTCCEVEMCANGVGDSCRVAKW